MVAKALLFLFVIDRRAGERTRKLAASSGL
jgi:hypothetical protein